ELLRDGEGYDGRGEVRRSGSGQRAEQGGVEPGRRRVETGASGGPPERLAAGELQPGAPKPERRRAYAGRSACRRGPKPVGGEDGVPRGAATEVSAGPSLDDVQVAHRRIAPFIHRTPVMTCAALDKLAGARLYFKCENLQKTGSFKIRGATNAILQLSAAEAARGVVTPSSGNHAAAVSRAAAARGIAAHIVMPKNSSPVKIRAVEGYGGVITFCEPNIESREAVTKRLLEETGGVLVHPYNDRRI